MEVIELLRQCMLQQVELRGGPGGTDVLATLQDSGRTVEDAFFSDVHAVYDGIESIAKAMEVHVAGGQAAPGGDRLPDAYCVASLLLSTADSVEADGEFPLSTLETNLKVRMAMKICLRALHLCCDAASAAANEVCSSMLPGAEGARLTKLVRLYLDSYRGQAALRGGQDDDNETVLRRMDADFKAQFQEAKDIGIGLLLRFQLADAAFNLSREFLYPRGLLDSSEMDSRLRLGDVFGSIAALQGTNAADVATCCFHILESGDERAGSGGGIAGRWGFDPSTIVRLGPLAPVQFEKYKKTRPHLQWIYGLDKGDFQSAAEGAMAHAVAGSQPDISLNLETLDALASVAKLSAYLSNEANPPDALAVLDQSKVIMDEIKSQDWLGQELGDASVLCGGKLPRRELIERMLSFCEGSKSADDIETAITQTLSLLSHCFNATENDAQLKQFLVQAWALCIRVDGDVFGSVVVTDVGSSSETENRLCNTLLYRVLSFMTRELRERKQNDAVMLTSEGDLMGESIKTALSRDASGATQRGVRACINLALAE
jgi:hypothetical protein